MHPHPHRQHCLQHPSIASHLVAQAAGGSKAGSALEKYSGVKVKVGCARELCGLCMGGW